LFYYFRLEDQIPENDLLRLIDKHTSFSFVRERLKDSYSETGRPSIDPELLRILLIGYLYGKNRTDGFKQLRLLRIAGHAALPLVSRVQQLPCAILAPTMAFGKCQGCEEYFESTSGEIPNFCPDCGAPVLERCPHCNFTLDELGFKPYLPYPEFCSNCGEWLFPKKAIGVPYLGFEPM
jgi:hypothetical protein